MLDPNSPGSVDDLAATTKLGLRIREDVKQTADIVNAIEWMRRQLEDLQPKLIGKDAGMKKSVAQMDQKLQAVEYRLFNKDMSPSDDKYYMSAYKVYFNLLWMYAEVNGKVLDVWGSAEQRPTKTVPMLIDMIEADLKAGADDYASLLAKDLPAFNRTLAERGLATLSTTPPAVREEQLEKDDEADASQSESEGEGAED
jgi:hypothetical protein